MKKQGSVQPKPWSEIEKLAKAASVHIDIGFGGTGVLLKGGLLLTAKHVSKGRVSFRVKTYSRDWLDATLVAEHPGKRSWWGSNQFAALICFRMA
ncbi:hypothetical protein ACFU8X_20285 [Brevibacillus porteri]|uniref:hypothetical protein n=1 Tax=Brevibacillus porteri TaxID=2126350 RepID=UPI003709EA6D